MGIYACLGSMFSKIYKLLFFILLLILSFLCTYLLCLNIEITTIIELLFGILLSIEGVLIVLSPVYFIYRNEKLKEDIKIMEENIPKENDISYFRDRVGQVSSGTLAFLLNKKIKFKDSIMASIFSLLYREYIKIENSKIFPTDKSKENLESNEKYIVDSHKFIFSFPEFKRFWEKYVIDDCIKKGYIERSKERNGNYILVLVGIIFFGVSLISLNFNNDTLFLLWFFDFFLFVLNVFIYSGICAHTNDNHKYVRTEEGQELYVKLIGLKKFLKDFSVIDERKKEELYIWEDYMIYAILFDLPGILDKEVNEQYSKLKLVEKG